MENAKKQKLSITLGELYNLAKELLDKEFDNRLNIEHYLRRSTEKIPNEKLFNITEEVLRQKVLIPIVNKTPECSDTWGIEK